jgi:hypothetical protein
LKVGSSLPEKPGALKSLATGAYRMALVRARNLSHVPPTTEARLSVTKAGRSTVVRLFDYLTPLLAEDTERLANAWIKSLRTAAIDGQPFRDRVTYHGDSLWWFAEIYLHKRRTINGVFGVIHALEALIQSEAPDRLAIVSGNQTLSVVAPQVAARRGVAFDAGATAARPGLRALGAGLLPALYAFGPLLKRLRRSRHAPVRDDAFRADVVVFVHSAFWNPASGDDTYVGPLVKALRADFGDRLRMVSLGPPTAFRARTWRTRLGEWRGGAASGPGEAAAAPAIETLSSLRALSGSRRIWRDRQSMAALLLSSEDLARACRHDGIDFAPLLREDFTGIATLQFPWSARAMDEAGAALDLIRPRVLVTYAEAGGWGRALVLEARRRGIASVGLQHGFISRHWLNYLHEPDEAMPSPAGEAGYPFPTLTLLYDDFAREHLIGRGHFPEDTLRVVGNPRLESLVRAAGALTAGELAKAREDTGARPDQHVVLLAIKYRTAWDETLRALAAAVGEMPDVHLVIRPHPGDAPGCYDGLISGLANARVAPRSSSPVALITSARLVVTINSTVAIEAMPLGVPALAMRLPNYLTPFVDAGAMAGTTAPQEIRPALARLVRDEAARADLLERSRRFIDRYRLVPDGDVGERTVREIRRLVD